MVKSNEFNYRSIFKDLGNICLSEGTCGNCKEKECLTGYAKTSLSQCLKNQVTYVREGCLNIPFSDTKGGYDEEYVMDAIAHLLNQCRSCEENHYADCLINVIRSSYEVMLFGEPQPYNGSAFAYLMKLQQQFPERAAYILEEYKTQGNLYNG